MSVVNFVDKKYNLQINFSILRSNLNLSARQNRMALLPVERASTSFIASLLTVIFCRIFSLKVSLFYIFYQVFLKVNYFW